VPTPTQQGIDQWTHRRRRLRGWFWVYLLISIVSAILFVRSFQSRDPYIFAILLAIPLFSLRQAWRMDRQIVDCDKHIRAPIITEIKEKS
jgi:apolipoprotein N-acyltransferase